MLSPGCSSCHAPHQRVEGIQGELLIVELKAFLFVLQRNHSSIIFQPHSWGL